ncbi:hypothetical protein F5Y03DRAFT_190312 [Xylaria venustula]|nr:hypothetical protein F5Y03DRAFT_190312 [Xylaria venustula]
MSALCLWVFMLSYEFIIPSADFNNNTKIRGEEHRNTQEVLPHPISARQIHRQSYARNAAGKGRDGPTLASSMMLAKTIAGLFINLASAGLYNYFTALKERESNMTVYKNQYSPKLISRFELYIINTLVTSAGCY